MILCYPNIHFLSWQYQLHFTDGEIASLKQSLRWYSKLVIKQVVEPRSPTSHCKLFPTGCAACQSPEYKPLMARSTAKTQWQQVMWDTPPSFHLSSDPGINPLGSCSALQWLLHPMLTIPRTRHHLIYHLQLKTKENAEGGESQF